jgi:hypothetical protein
LRSTRAVNALSSLGRRSRGCADADHAKLSHANTTRNVEIGLESLGSMPEAHSN